MDAMWSGAYIFPALYALGTVEPGKSFKQKANIDKRFIPNEHTAWSLKELHCQLSIEIFQKKKRERGKR